MRKKVEIFGIFNGNNIRLENIDADLSVKARALSGEVFIKITGEPNELLRIRVSHNESILLIEGDGNRPGLEKMTVFRFENIKPKCRTQITVKMPRGGSLELASSFSGKADIDDKIRVAKEI